MSKDEYRISTPLKTLATEIEELMFPDGLSDTITGEINAVASRQTFCYTYLITSRGEHTIINGHRHPRMKVIQAWVELKDNSERSQRIEVIGVTKPQDIAESYKAGVAILLPLRYRTNEIHFVSDIKVKADTDRLVSVTLLCESTEEQP